MSYHNFISLLQAGENNVNVTVRLLTYDQAVTFASGDQDPFINPNLVNIDITTTFTLTGGNDIATSTIQLLGRINTFLIANTAMYSGIPIFTGDYPNPTFRTTRTDHIIPIWSQAQFQLFITLPADTDWIIKTTPKPILVTIDDAHLLASISGVDLSDINDADLTNEQLAALLEMASNNIVDILDNNIVTCPYLHEEIGRGTRSIFFKKRPVYDFDVPFIRRPRITQLTTFLINRSKSAYILNKQNGELQYRFTNDLVEVDEAFGLNNEIKCSYIAGNQNIPTVVKQAVLIFGSKILENTNMRSLKGAGFQVEFRPAQEEVIWILTQLRPWNLR